MKITLTIRTENAAFDDGQGGALEIARILRVQADRFERESLDKGMIREVSIRDANGNTVGTVKLGR